MGQFEVWESKQNLEWRWRFRANDARIIADSGVCYDSKDDWLSGIRLIKNEVPDAKIVFL